MDFDFRKPYKRNIYLDFFKNQFLPEDFMDCDEKIVLSYKSDFVQDVVKIGEVRSLDLNIYEIKHTSENDPRISLSKFSFRLLAQYGQKSALIFFISKNSQNFRLSLVTIDLKWEEGKRVKKEYSNPRRYSFFLGPDAKTHTPYEYLIRKGRVKDFDDLKERFSIEVVNKEFYTKIALCFSELAGGKRNIGRQMKDFGEGCLKLPSTSDDTLRKEFSVRLIGRLVFCWFLKKKHSEKGLALLPEEILSKTAIKRNNEYYHNVLELLFFEVLNTKQEKRNKKYKEVPPWSQVPFLNGGLFTPDLHDYYEIGSLGISKNVNTLKIPDKWLEGVFDIFETYNFTIDENTSVDVELAIDPEMLGRIFENLLAEINPETGESARKSTGSYYTPRSIVEYMVDESLKQYLLTRTGLTEDKVKSLLSYEQDDPGLNETEKNRIIDALDTIKIIDPACGSGAFPMGILQKMLIILQKVDPYSQKWLVKKLALIDNETIKREAEERLKEENWNYIHKLGIIQTSIFGVDIQSIAAEVSKLRFFLSLVVDEKVEDTKYNRGVQPLPNLEFKFVCANSLIGLPKKDAQKDMFEAGDNINTLKELREKYMRSYGEEKEDIKKDFEKIQSRMFERSLHWGGKETETLKLSQWKPFSGERCGWFDPDWMFGVGGFDIVISNPPYTGYKGHKNLFREIKQNGLKDYYQGKMDYFYFFFHLALNLGKSNSNIAFITTNYYPTATGAKKLRQDFKERTIIKNLNNFNELKIFESALGQHNMIAILEKAQNESAIAQTCITKRQGTATSEILQQILNRNDIETSYYKVAQKDLYDGDEYYIRLTGVSGNSENPIQSILNKVKKQGVDLSIISNVNTGIMGGCDYISKRNVNYCSNQERARNDIQIDDGVFILDETNERDRNAIKNIKKSGYLYNFYKNSDIERYNSRKETSKYIIFSSKDNGAYKNRNIKNHLDKFRRILEKNREINNEDINHFPFLRRGTAHQYIFESAKIVAPQRSPLNTFGYNEIPWYASADVYFITEKDKTVSLKYLLALLNSKLYYLWLYHRGKRKGEALELYQTPLSEIPIKNISSTDQKPFIEIVDKILNITTSEGYLENEDKKKRVKEYERQIDQIVYKLYGLTNDEIKIVEGKK